MQKLAFKVMLLFVSIVIIMYLALVWNAELNEMQELKEKQAFYDAQCKLLGENVMNYTDENCSFSFSYLDENAKYYACDILCKKNVLTYNLTNTLNNPFIELKGETPKTFEECFSFASTNPNESVFTIRFVGTEQTCFLDVNLSVRNVCDSITVPEPYSYVFENNSCYLKQTIAIPIK